MIELNQESIPSIFKLIEHAKRESEQRVSKATEEKTYNLKLDLGKEKRGREDG